MESITVHCKMCKHAMRFSAEKAGKRARCPKCDTIVLVVAEEAIEKTEEPAPQAVAAPAAPAAQTSWEEDDGPAAYDVFLDPELEERRKALQKEEERAKKKQRQKLPGVGRKVKVIPDAEAWKKVRLGLLFIQIGAWIWFAMHLLQFSYVLLGYNEFSEYATLIATNLEARGGENDFPARGDFWDLDQLNVCLGMIAGHDFLGYARLCITIGIVFYFIQALLWGVGYGFCLPVPRRFGTFLQLIISLVLAFVNLLIMFIFKFLPIVGAVGYVLIPFVTPEIMCTTYNMERTVPIQVMWAGWPFTEEFFTIVFLFLFYLQPAFGCIFLWSVGISLRNEGVESSARGLTQLCLGTFFVLLCFHLLSVCGASPVLVGVLRVFYGVWFFFALLFIAQYAVLLGKCRAVLYEKIYPKFELEE